MAKGKLPILALMLMAAVLLTCGTAAWADTINWGPEKTGEYNETWESFDLSEGKMVNLETGDFSLDPLHQYNHGQNLFFNTKIIKWWATDGSITDPTLVTGQETVMTECDQEPNRFYLVQCRDNSYAKILFTGLRTFRYVLQEGSLVPDTASSETTAGTSGTDTTTETDNSGTTTPGTSTPGATTPGTTEPGTATPGTGTPGTGMPGVGPSMPGTGGSPVNAGNTTNNLNQNTNTTTNNANTNINITGSTVSNSNIGSNNQVNQSTTNNNSITVTQYVTVMIDGQPLQSDVKPFVNADGRTMLPVRPVAEALGAQVQWDEGTQTATLTQGGKNVKVPVGQKTISVDGKPVTMDTAAVVKDGRTLLPVRPIAEALGVKIDWDEVTSTVKIETDSEAAPLPFDTDTRSAGKSLTQRPAEANYNPTGGIITNSQQAWPNDYLNTTPDWWVSSPSGQEQMPGSWNGQAQ